MGFWVWFIIWTALAAGATVFLASILRGLGDSAKRLERQLAQLDEKLQKLKAEVGKIPALERGESDVLAELSEVIAKRNEFLQAREKKRNQRQRRLERVIRDFKPEESRFNK